MSVLYCTVPDRVKYSRVNPGKYGQGGKYGQMAHNSHVQEHRSVTTKCFISAFISVH